MASRWIGRISWLFAAVAILLLAACAAPQAGYLRAEPSVVPDVPLGAEPYQVGPVSVWVRPQPEVEFLCRMRLGAIRRDQRVMGCYLEDSRTIVSVADPYVLMHEFKHHFEGKFHH